LVVRKIVLLSLAAMAVGLALGLVLGWVVWPVQYYDTDFASLHPEHRLDYVLMVAAVYQDDGDWPRALTRLQALDEPDLPGWVRDLTHRAIAEARDLSQIRRLVALSSALGVRSDLMEPFARD